MTRFNSTARLALLAAIPIEAANYWLVGYPADTSFAGQSVILAVQWYVIHLPAVIALDRSHFLQHAHVIGSIVLLLCGWFDTALLITGLIYLWRLSRRIARKLSSPTITNRTEL
jgi:hypothetical protein